MTDYICLQCHYEGPPRKRKRGSTRVEATMWMLFPFGLPYTFWRMLTKTSECRHCGSHSIAHPKSDTGRALLAKITAELNTPSPKSQATLTHPAATLPITAPETKMAPAAPETSKAETPPTEQPRRPPPNPDTW